VETLLSSVSGHKCFFYVVPWKLKRELFPSLTCLLSSLLLFKMVAIGLVVAVGACISIASGACPYMDNDARDLPASHPPVRRDATATDEFLSQYEIDDTDVYLTSDVGGPIADHNSLKAGERGPTYVRKCSSLISY
jgi:hypothetical protein